MKPNEARQQHLAREQARKVRGERLEAVLKTGAAPDKPRPDLVPTATDKRNTLRQYRRFARLAAGEMQGSAKYEQFLELLIVELARLIYIERCLALDELDRASLTPARLMVLSVVDPAEIKRRLDALQDDGTRGLL